MITYTVSDHDPALRRLCLLGTAGLVQVTDTIELQPLGNEVWVRYTVQFTVSGLAMLMTPWLSSAMTTVADDVTTQMETVLDQL